MSSVSKTPSQFKLKQIRILEQKIRACQFTNPRLAQAYRQELKKLKDEVYA
jgi:hypothetical protein